ncbi:hypothetical protein OG226_00505 [Streptomyces sp. NBC_01261]|uniref:hypothetical protein n=1 Tax=Streptomyces sp. NBC_01261 TaxID=2903802 RepID=UPI002E2F24FF|nr:hypothetical protein [Streptomyces sp. NBC_01261]
MTTKSTATEGDLLIAELARRGRRAYLGDEGGATFLITTADPDAPDDEDSAYTTAHLLMYAGEHADRPAGEHTEPWSAHLHDPEGNYIDTLFAGSGTPLDAETDAALFAAQVCDWIDDRRKATARPDTTPAPASSADHRAGDLTLAELLASAADNHAGLGEHLGRDERDDMYDTITKAYVTQIGVALIVALSTTRAAFPEAQPARQPYQPRRPLRELTLADFLHLAHQERAALSEHLDHGDRADAFTFAVFAESHGEVLGRYLRLARHDHDTGRAPVLPASGSDAS